MELSVWADGIICDYNYVFDPNAHLKRFFADGGNNHYLFLVDEAHNLVERGREMYSASLYKEDVLEVKRIVKGKDKKLTRSLESMNKAFLELKRECENYQILDSVSVLALKAMNLLTEMERYLEEQREQGRQDETEEVPGPRVDGHNGSGHPNVRRVGPQDLQRVHAGHARHHALQRNPRAGSSP